MVLVKSESHHYLTLYYMTIIKYILFKCCFCVNGTEEKIVRSGLGSSNEEKSGSACWAKCKPTYLKYRFKFGLT